VKKGEEARYNRGGVQSAQLVCLEVTRVRDLRTYRDRRALEGGIQLIPSYRRCCSIMQGQRNTGDAAIFGDRGTPGAACGGSD